MASPTLLLQQSLHLLTTHIYLSLTALALTLLAAYRLATYDPRRRHLPPTPPAWPVVNHTFLQAEEDAPPLLQRWAREHGEVFRTVAGSSEFIWLNSMEAVKELYDRRSANYSSRQPMPMACDLATGAKRITFLPYGKPWRRARGVFHKVLTPKMADDYSVIQSFESKQLTVDLLDSPADFYMHNRRYAVSVIFQVTYGWRIPEWDCDDVRRIFEVLGRFVQVRRPGQWLVDVYPQLARNPLFNAVSSWKRVGREFHDKDEAIFMGFWNRMKASVKDGTAPHCFAKVLLANYEKQGLTESQAAWICGGLLEAGSETTSATLNNALLLLLSNPAAIRAAHAELDRVIGRTRTPTFADEPSLPFIRGIIKETLRMRPINKFGNNHSNLADDWYGGFFIPRGSIVMANWWAIHYDERLYPDPFTFRPERWAAYPHSAAAAAALADGTQRDHLSYGGGRRICAGMHLAEKSLFIDVARILWGFDLGLARDENGREIPLNFSTKGMVKGSSSLARPFKCSITPRSAGHERIMRREWDEARAQGIDFSHIKWSV